MRLHPTLILLPALAALVSCGPSANSDCAGWRPVQIDEATVDRLAADDPEALRALIGHHETGKARGCW